MTDSSLAPWIPVFEPGQIITASELNQLYDVLAERDRFSTRHLSGHGVLFGLKVTLDRENRSWYLQPGAAVDRFGYVLLVTEPVQLSPCNPPGGLPEEHPLIRLDPDVNVPNFTPVLLRRDLEQSVAEESSTGRRRFARTEIRLVPGRVHPTRPAEYELVPMQFPEGLRIQDGAKFNHDFERNRTLLREILQGEPEFGGEVHNLIDSLRLSRELQTGVPTARDVLTIALMNDAIATMWQWARAAQYIDLHLNHPDRPWPHKEEQDEHGVPLGWMYEDSKQGWMFDSRWRAHFAIGLSRLEHVVGYSPEGIREICVERMSALAQSVNTLRPFQAADISELQSARADAWFLNPDQMAAGTAAWQRTLRFDRPRKEATFWPPDPLRSATDAPASVEPYPRATDPRPPRPEVPVRCPAPSPVDPVNDPFAFSSYADLMRLDRWNTGMIALAALIGFPVEEAQSILASIEHRGGEPARGEVVSIDDHDGLLDIEVVLLASMRDHLVILTQGDQVVAFGIRKRPKRVAPAPKPEPKRGLLARMRRFMRQVMGDPLPSETT